MNPDRWRRIKEVFHLALDRAPEERPPFLDNACAGDDKLRAEVERLLIAHVKAGSFIETSPVTGMGQPSARMTASLTGRSLDHYRVGRLIGAGGMGEVYAARDTDLGRDVALKVVGSGGSAAAQLALRREAQRASQLNHPNICTIHEVGAFEGQAYIVMEYVEGSPLSDVIGCEGLPLETMLRYGIHVADALAHAHGQGIVHRDLKSANVAVTSDGRAKVLDFGLAHAMSAEHAHEMTQTRAASTSSPPLAGTLSHMAPELLRGAAPSSRSDIWALGVVLYEMASGRRPFDGETSFELSAAILHAAPAALPPRIPAALQTIIRRCLAKDPHERYGQAIEVRSAMEAVRAEVSSGTRHPIAAPRAQRVIRALRATAIVIAVMTVTVVAGVFAWRWMNGSGEPVGVGASGRPAVAVMSFDNMAGTAETAWLSKGIPSMLLTGLAQTRGLDIVSAQRLQEAVREIGADTLESLDRSQVPEVARRAGAGAVVVGSIFHAGTEIRIDAQVEDLSTGRVLAAESVRGTDVFAIVDRLAARIRNGVGFTDAADIRSVADVSSNSLEAYRLYSQGLEAEQHYRLEDAQALLEQAIAIDPEFAAAYLRLALFNDMRGRPGARRDYFRKAAEHADRLSERERLLLEIELTRDEGNSATAARLLDELLAKFPDSEDAYTSASHFYAPFGLSPDVKKSLAITTAGVMAMPESRLLRNQYGYALLYAGRFPEAVREFETYARISPREANPYDSLGEAHVMMGLPEQAIDDYARAMTVDPMFEGSHVGRAWGLAMLGRYDEAIDEDRSPTSMKMFIPSRTSMKAFLLSRVGRYREALRVLDAGHRQTEIDQNLVDQAVLRLFSAVIALERGQLAQARTDLRAAEQRLAGLPEQRRRFYLVLLELLAGMVEVKAGQLVEARAHLESLKSHYRADLIAERWWARSLEGDIALAEGRLAEAAAAYAAGEPSIRMWTNMVRPLTAILANNSPSRDGAARVMKARGDLAGAIQDYRRLLGPANQQKFAAMLEPRHILELARLLEQAGDKSTARQEYQRFLDFWKNADAGLPEIVEARRALARL